MIQSLNHSYSRTQQTERTADPATGGGRVDTVLLAVTLCLVGIGILMVYSAGHLLSAIKYDGDSYRYLKVQVIACIIGLIGMGVTSYIPYRFYEKHSTKLLILAFIGLILVFTPWLGSAVQGAAGARFNRWIERGGLRFQPVEFAKIALIIHTARFLARNPERIKSFFNGVLPNIIVLGSAFALVAAQPDFGSAVLLVATVGFLLIVGGVRFSQTVILIGVAVAVLAVFIAIDPYRSKRVTDYWASLQSTGEVGYQLERSLNALRWGGLFGVGIDESVAKINYLPEPHTDFIFAVLAEEFGFIGTSSVTLIFMIFVWRGISIAMRTENRFGALFATGLTVVIGLQAFINIGVVTGLLPTKGITLPFLSYGGSSLVISLISVGLLLNISRHVQKTQH